MRIGIFAIVLAAAAIAPSAGSAAGFAGALSLGISVEEGVAGSREIRPDAAARLTEAGEHERALRALGATDDSLRAGILSCYAERYAEAAALLGGRSGNPYLEWLRLYYRALALHESGRPREAIVDLDRFFVLTEELAVQPSGGVGAEARDLRIAAVAGDDSLWIARGDLLRLEGGADARERLVVAKAYLDRGLDSLAAEAFLGGRFPAAAQAPGELLWTVVDGVFPFLDQAPTSELASLASRAISEGRLAEARRLVALLQRMDDTDEGIRLLEARIRLAEGERPAALEALRAIASTAVSPRVRAEASRRAAELELRGEDLAAAAARYRALADSTGDPAFIDQAARIELRLGDAARALALWERHDAALEKDRGAPRAARASFAGLERGALLHRLSRDAEAYAILRDTPATGARDRAGRLFWLSATAPDDSTRARHAAELLDEYPHSLYAQLAGSGFDSLARVASAADRSARIGRLLAAEWGYLDSLGAAMPPEGWLERHPARAAYLWTLDRGLVAEASEFAIALERTRVARAPEALALYRDARERGYCDFAIWLASGPFAEETGPAALARLQYPVAYAATLSDGDLTARLAPELLLAVMHAESKFGPAALSRSGAVGVMQLMPATARWFSRTRGWSDGYCRDLREPACNIRIGAHYLAYLLDRSGGSVVAALAAYNAGERRMAGWRKAFDPSADAAGALELISPAETAAYVKNVLDAFRRYRLAGEGKPVTP